MEELDVLVVGAGLSGLGMGRWLRVHHPRRTFAILEARGATGGTWDLFRYPGVRSDSDMYTLGYGWRPWRRRESMAAGSDILDYLRETAAETGADAHVRLHHRVVSADWDSATARWRVDVAVGDPEEGPTTSRTFHARWLFSAAGYYRHDQGHDPVFVGRDDFAGEVVHPQLWPEDFTHSGKRVVVIGSGATAVTLVPALVRGPEAASHVTMLQRTPTYVTSLPQVDTSALWIRRLLGERRGLAAVRRRNIAYAHWMWERARRDPEGARRRLRAEARRALPSGLDVDIHFNPPYDPWDQRLCLVPDGDLFRALASDRAAVVTDHVDRFTRTGVRLASGTHLDADVIVTATGLELQFVGGVDLRVDGVTVDPGQLLTYRGAMLSGVPNFAFALGYTNASWTLKVDLVCEFVCRLLEHMDARGHAVVRPLPDPDTPRRPTEFAAGYVRRAQGRMPDQGEAYPWAGVTGFRQDRRLLDEQPLVDRHLHFSAAPPAEPRVATRLVEVAR